ncbi:hypothetical protein D3C85_955140 [compost metagenome]
MPRYINFGQDIYKTFLCILYQLFNIFLCIKTTISAGLIGSWWDKVAKSPGFFNAPGTYFGQFRQAFNLNTPAFIISQVQVQQVKLIAHHIINKLLYFLLGKKVTGYIEH